MPALSFESLRGGEVSFFLAVLCFYFVGVWIPAFYMLYLSLAKRAAKFNNFCCMKWTWLRQYMFLECMFRFHVVLVLMVVIIVSFESYPVYLRAAGPIVLVLLTILLKYISYESEKKIASNIQRTNAVAGAVTNTLRFKSASIRSEATTNKHTELSEVKEDKASKPKVHKKVTIEEEENTTRRITGPEQEMHMLQNVIAVASHSSVTSPHLNGNISTTED